MANYTPIEVVLDVRSYQNVRERPQGGGAGKDHFAGADAAFNRHRDQLHQALENASRVLAKQGGAQLGYLKVAMRPDALAKSHRPIRALFPSRATPIVGIEGPGELIVQVTSASTAMAAEQVASAEIEVLTKEKLNKKTGETEEVPNPSIYRIETSAIDKVTLWGAPDKRAFSLDAAIKWASEKNLPLRYRIDLFDFEMPTDRKVGKELGNFSPSETFFQALGEVLGKGYFGLLSKPRANSIQRLYIWLLKDPQVATISTRQGRIKHSVSDIDVDVRRHKALLEFLDENLFVRRISLPSTFHKSAASSNRSADMPEFAFPLPQEGAEYPIVGIIDGGVSSVPAEWIKYQVATLPAAHMDGSHGTEIASLLIAGQQLNSADVCPEPDGCFIADIAMVPEMSHYSQHYSGEDQDFLDDVEHYVRLAKDGTGVRIFCFCHNVDQFSPSVTYDVLSAGLDDIALRNDVIFVVCTGNVTATACRPEWKATVPEVLSDLASAVDDRIRIPGDSIYNVSVGALNPAACALPANGAPARYSRRGPGFRNLVKPDLVHFGGLGQLTPGSCTELRAMSKGGGILWLYGTSYSAPLAAKTLARIDQMTNGGLTREALIAIGIHGAALPEPVKDKAFDKVRRDLVGYGCPTSAEPLLAGKPTAATLVFMDKMQYKKDLFFKLQWPACLTEGGKCRGVAKATLVYAPPSDERFGAELIRVDLEVALHQRSAKTAKYQSRTRNVFKFKSANEDHELEQDLISESLKWNNVKQVVFESTRGVGESSDWQLSVKYLERAEGVFPPLGVPFAVILTIEDPENVEPVHQDMRAALTANAIQTTDIHALTEARVRSGAR